MRIPPPYAYEGLNVPETVQPGRHALLYRMLPRRHVHSSSEHHPAHRLLPEKCVHPPVSYTHLIQAGASTGGMDIPPLVIEKKLGFPVSVSLYLFDFSILILQIFISDREQVLLSLIHI